MKHTMNTGKKVKLNKSIELEKTYLQYLTPMPIQEWQNIKSLRQPTLLKQVPTKTSCSSKG
jgi:hypothetical protein